MAKNKNGRPEWFKFWRRNRGMLDIEALSIENRGIVFTNIMRYFDTGYEELLPMAPIETFAFNVLRQNADEAIDEYEEMVEKNRKNGSKGGRPPKNKDGMQ